ncbi:2-amino-4-hydroxy-6-hydroxymethyldihydropteridine diphosphokinase [Microbaculum marinum]|uniref:2-amino-4-hydroxy-6-hydroxymethyldihydropteridine pyrophosphokinase n=1 Tax=Microbaculum marinum TaxID=1764581 RepID=A0AAW9RKT2_9HYPH
MAEVGFSLGSNIGDKQGNLARALELLFADPAMTFRACSSFYKTAPWGYEDQDWFVNLCAAGDTGLEAESILDLCKRVEHEVGRRDTFRWGPRVIDVDILYYGTAEVDEPDLAIPHRELFNRSFVLVPLAEIRPDLVLSGRRIGEEARRLVDDGMEIVAPPWAPGK